MIGTVVNCPYGNVLTGPYDPLDRVDVLWHQIGIAVGVQGDSIVPYVSPLDAPGRSTRAHRTWAALQVVMNAEQPHAMEEMQPDLERARMTAEEMRTRISRANTMLKRAQLNDARTALMWDDASTSGDE